MVREAPLRQDPFLNDNDDSNYKGQGRKKDKTGFFKQQKPNQSCITGTTSSTVPTLNTFRMCPFSARNFQITERWADTSCGFPRWEGLIAFGFLLGTTCAVPEVNIEELSQETERRNP